MDLGKIEVGLWKNRGGLRRNRGEVRPMGGAVLPGGAGAPRTLRRAACGGRFAFGYLRCAPIRSARICARFVGRGGNMTAMKRAQAFLPESARASSRNLRALIPSNAPRNARRSARSTMSASSDWQPAPTHAATVGGTRLARHFRAVPAGCLRQAICLRRSPLRSGSLRFDSWRVSDVRACRRTPKRARSARSTPCGRDGWRAMRTSLTVGRCGEDCAP